jgi:putative DNA primase/helicase
VGINVANLDAVRARLDAEAGAVAARNPVCTGPESPSMSEVQYHLGEPVPCAQAFVASAFRLSGSNELVFWRDQFLRWHSGAWLEIPTSEVSAAIYEFLDRAQQKPTRRSVADVLDALKAVVILNSRIEPPCWLDEAERAASHLIVCRNGAFDLASGDQFELTPRLFSRVTLPIVYDPATSEPSEWLKFLRSVWPQDGEAIETLQEIGGLLLLPITKFQKLFLLVGPKRSGKGTILRTLAAMLGAGNVAAPTLGSLAMQFGLQPLIGKLAAFVSDARLSGRVDQATIVERLLSISGEDPISVPRKFLTDFATRLPVRFVLSSNELLRLPDSSGAVASRFIVLLLTRSFYGREDLELERRLTPELPGILNWCIAGLRRLLGRGRFKQPSSASNAIEQLEELGSPITAFLREMCMIVPGSSIPVEDLYAAYRRWCEAAGRDRPGSAQTFGRDLHAVCPGLRVSQPRGPDGRQHRRYEGVDLTRTDTHGDALHSHTHARVTCNEENRVSPRVTCAPCDGEGCRWCAPDGK